MAPTTADKDLATRIRERGLRVTPQRLLIHRALRELDRHVTAEELLEAVSEKLPNASLPTVYAALELFEDLGAVRRVPVTGGPALFDPRVDPHQHMHCRRCGAVADLDTRLDTGRALGAARRRGFRPDSAELVVSGLCAECAASTA
jgi:Fe2+ or Zn2+ uptake regulation protein